MREGRRGTFRTIAGSMKLYFSPLSTANLLEEVLTGPFFAMFSFHSSTSLFLADLPLQIWSGGNPKGPERRERRPLVMIHFTWAFMSQGKKGKERESWRERERADFGTLRKTCSTKPAGREPHLRAFSCSEPAPRCNGPLNTRAPLSPARQTLQPYCLLPPTLKPTLDSSAPI